MNRDVLSLKHNLGTCSKPSRDQVFHNLLLRIDCDSMSRQGFEIDAMPLFSETNLHAVMNQAFPLHSVAYTHFCQKVDRTLLQDSSSHSLLTVLPAPRFDHNRINPFSVQQMRQNQPGRSSPHNPHLCASSHGFFRRDFRGDLRSFFPTENISITSRGTGLPSIRSGSASDTAAQTLISKHSTASTSLLNSLW